MKMFFIQEARYLEYENQLYSLRIDYKTYWNRYLESFDKVVILARVKKVETLPRNYLCSTGNKVSYIPIEDYEGPYEFLRIYRNIIKQMKEAFKSNYFVVIRVPSHLGVVARKLLKKNKQPYSVEIVGDPKEVGKHLSIPKSFGWLYGKIMSKIMKKTIKGAIGTIYVTRSMLQTLYPPNKQSINSYASNVEIHDEYCLTDITKRKSKILSIPNRIVDKSKDPIILGIIGMLYPIKSPLEILNAFHLLLKKKYNLKLKFVGDGPLLSSIEKKAKSLNIQDRVICLGSLSTGKEIFSFIDSIDLYIQFSKTEGLPRAMVEAMSRSCPVISSNVGGISELLPEEMLINSFSYKVLAEKIEWLLSDEKLMLKAAIKNNDTSKAYLDSKLMKKRLDFYKQIRNILN